MHCINKQEESGGRKKPNIYVHIFICLIIIDIVLLVVMLLYNTGVLSAGGKNDRVFNVSGSSTNMTRLDAIQFCNSQKKELPHPNSQEEEEQTIKDINNSPASKCSLVYLAYTADEIRYNSRTNRDKHWKAIKFDPEVGNDPSTRLNYRLTIQNGSVMTSQTSKLIDDPSGISQKNLLLIAHRKGDKECTKHPFSCIYFYASKTTNTTASIYNDAVKDLKEQEIYVDCMVPYDPDQYPRNFFCVNCPIEQTVAFTVAARYRIVYLYKGDEIGYKSKRFVVLDPEYNCLAYELKNDKVVTVDCDEKACVTCV